MNVLHPDVLVQHDISPEDYKDGLVFRSAVESIRGNFIASSVTGREGLVGSVLERLLRRGQIADYRRQGGKNRFDFAVAVKQDPDYCAAIEVKGGEGNSINISERPVWAREFAVWCHLDGAVVNEPAHAAHSIINRLTNELVMREKKVDVLFFKDRLCGTRTRPCPKYPHAEHTIGFNTAPDVFLLPQRVPKLEDPEPPVHSLKSTRLARLILNLFQVPPRERPRHIWEVHVKFEELPNRRARRAIRIMHQGQIVDEATSRTWIT